MKQTVQSFIPIRAAVLREPGCPLKIERLEMEGPRDDEVLVRLVASGICHTDIDFWPLEACRGGFSLSGIKVQSTQMEEDVRLETLFVPIAKGLFDQTLDFIVEALNGTIG